MTITKGHAVGEAGAPGLAGSMPPTRKALERSAQAAQATTAARRA
jgi:hypothetical protein